MFNWFETNLSEIMSFVSGVLVTTFAFIVGPKLKDKMQSRSEKSEMGDKEKVSTEDSYRKVLIEALQKEHLSSAFFALDEIGIAPAFILPDSKFDPKLSEDLTEQMIEKRWLPLIPTAINGISMISDQLISFSDLIREKQRLLVHGESGVGKSFSLAWLALELAKESGKFSPLTGKIPFFIQANALIPYLDSVDDASADKVPPFYFNYDSTTFRRFFRQSVETNRAVFFIDNIDQLTYEEQTRVLNWLNNNEYISSKTPLFISMGNKMLPDIEKLNIFPVTLAAFDESRARTFLKQWRDCWQKFVSEATFGENMKAMIQNEWLTDGFNILNPLELTLRSLSVYLGDLISPSYQNLIKSAIYREIEGHPVGLRILTALAVQLHAKHQLRFDRAEFEDIYQSYVKTSEENESSVPRIRKILESGLFASSFDSRNATYRFKHDSFLAYLIGESDEVKDVIDTIPVDLNQWQVPMDILRVVIDQNSAKEAVTKIISNSKTFFAGSDD